MDKKEKNKIEILKVLDEAHSPLGSSRIAERLVAGGHDVSERTIRFYLLALDKEGMTENLGKKGRCITERGSEELSKDQISQKVGFFGAEIDQISYRMNFNLSKKSGSVAQNFCYVDPEQLERFSPAIQNILSAGYGMGELMSLTGNGDAHPEGHKPPEGMVGFGTSCCINVNGTLLANGIPATPRFGGLLEIKNGKPVRFVEIIYYEGATLDPLEIFIKSGMTDVMRLAQTGSGRIVVGFHEAPGNSRERLIEISRQLKKAGLGGIFGIGWPGQPLLGIPVGEGRVGFIVACGLNSIAALDESGVKINHRFTHTLIDYENLFKYAELDARLRRLHSPQMPIGHAV